MILASATWAAQMSPGVAGPILDPAVAEPAEPSLADTLAPVVVDDLADSTPEAPVFSDTNPLATPTAPLENQAPSGEYETRSQGSRQDGYAKHNQGGSYDGFDNYQYSPPRGRPVVQSSRYGGPSYGAPSYGGRPSYPQGQSTGPFMVLPLYRRTWSAAVGPNGPYATLARRSTTPARFRRGLFRRGGGGQIFSAKKAIKKASASDQALNFKNTQAKKLAKENKVFFQG
ncbi:hypothetical protein BJ085DRAFT_37746 [Dimargaris cristalligena]|uniref:Uncharacterized protein n=1 Tax=Dimargaris cristalligena TaxID=215637 RepID=A0A4Q0A2W4_9FUNG|nr:hypothetical protein BJ085DRAFT_37746 [Dimargaris cristalligena]|eukprot:RKP40463.1 hypothetical protein BJ085DRAFT_37746 [Dimargaris cristalligena]